MVLFSSFRQCNSKCFFRLLSPQRNFRSISLFVSCANSSHSISIPSRPAASIQTLQIEDSLLPNFAEQAEQAPLNLLDQCTAVQAARSLPCSCGWGTVRGHVPLPSYPGLPCPSFPPSIHCHPLPPGGGASLSLSLSVSLALVGGIGNPPPDMVSAAPSPAPLWVHFLETSSLGASKW